MGVIHVISWVLVVYLELNQGRQHQHYQGETCRQWRIPTNPMDALSLVSRVERRWGSPGGAKMVPAVARHGLRP